MSTAPKPTIVVAFYSTYGHVGALAEEIIKGAESTGAIVKPYFIQETLSEEVLGKMHAGSSLKPKYPVLHPNDLKEADGIVFGAPTRYGHLPAQVDAFFDHCGQLWATGALVGKFVTTFTSTAGQHAGQETTTLTSLPFFIHHGLAYVPIGYGNAAVGGLTEVQGGSPYGASTLAAADGSRQPSPVELEIAEYQGKYFADFVGTFVKGKHAATAATTTTGTTAAVGGAAATANGTSTDKAAPSDPEPAAAPATATATPTATASDAATPTATSTLAATEKPTEKSTETPAAAAAATTAPATTAAAAAPAAATAGAHKKKKGGLFSCCGDSNID